MTDALVEAIREFSSAGTRIRIEGGGTKSFLGHVDSSAPVLSTRSHTGVMSYEPAELILRARAGTTIDEIDKLLAENGQMLGFEPPAFDGKATLGGTIAAGLSGARRPFAGSARDFVLGIGLVTAQGQYLEFGGQVMKNVAGFDVSRLMVGAFGTLGVIADVSMKVLPRPEVETTVRATMGRSDAHSLMISLANRSLPLSGACQSGEGVELRFSGAASAVERAMALRELSEFEHAGADYLSAMSSLAHYRVPGAVEGDETWRISVPPASVDLLDESVAIDWAGAQRFLVNPAFDPQTRIESGHATCITGARRGFAELSAPVRKIHERLKLSFDPNRMFNAGRMYDWL